MSPFEIKKFQKTVLDHYKKHGRDLPWRRTTDPYRILVSEIMLQQTQVSRVTTKYKEFLAMFPTTAHLAAASNGDVLKVWQGLGYNRRALALKKIADAVVSEHRGRIPGTKEALEQLPGIGAYTAAAICAFAYNAPHVCIETNIRRVFIHHFFLQSTRVSDKELVPYIEQTLPKRDVRTWYWALMDYGAWLAKEIRSNPNRQSRHYVRQSKFEGSVRQVRGQIMRLLIEKKKMSERALHSVLANDKRIAPALAGLVKDALVVRQGSYFLLAA